jgi:hypothetical protein
MQEGETEEDVNVSVEILPHILKNVLDTNRKRKADGSIGCRSCKVHAIHSEDPGDVEADRQGKLKEYCNWSLAEVRRDRWREALQARIRFAMEQFLELNSIPQHLRTLFI